MVENEKYFDEAIPLFLDWYGEKNKSTLAGWVYIMTYLFEERIYGI
jgi:hypothetical protein